MEPLLERRTGHVMRSRILVDPARNVSRGGRSIDPTADATIELALLIEQHGGLIEPVCVREIPRDKEGHDVRLVFGFRRICASDVLHEEDYPVFVVYSHAETDFEEALENFAENLSHRMPADWEIGEGIVTLRSNFPYTIDQAVDTVFGRLKTTGSSLMHTRARDCAYAWAGLIPELQTLWKKNTARFQLRDARDVSKLLPEEQLNFLENFVQAERVRAQRIAAGLPAEEPVEKVRVRPPRRPGFNALARAYNSIRKDEKDEHDDGLSPEERVILRRWFRYQFAITDAEGKPAPCPIRLRKVPLRKSMTDTPPTTPESPQEET